VNTNALLLPRAARQTLPFWKRRGGFADVARRAKVRPPTLSNIAHRRTGASAYIANALERASGVPAREWINSRTSRHPAFFGPPQKRALRPSRGGGPLDQGSFWKQGQKAEVCRAVGMAPQRFSAIIHRSRGVSPRVALQLEEATMAITGRRVPAIEWITCTISRHPAFYPRKPGKAL
jgi:plasmid maintenance system antidote protein VapI